MGGLSRRFGSPKALAPFDGRTLAEHMWGVLGEACEERLALGKLADELSLPFRVRDDGIGVRAPIAGVVAGLRAARNDVCVFLPVDVPLVTPELVSRLGDACRDAAVPMTGPLPGAYAKSSLPLLERHLADGRLALRDAIADLDVAVLRVDAAELANVNEPEQLSALQS